MNFCISVHCLDGRVQEPVIKYLKENYIVSYVDTITEAGPIKIISENKEKSAIDSIIEKINISIKIHGSKVIAVSGHYDCAGNPVDEKVQRKQIRLSIKNLKKYFPGIQIVGLWINNEWKVNKVV